ASTTISSSPPSSWSSFSLPYVSLFDRINSIGKNGAQSSRRRRWPAQNCRERGRESPLKRGKVRRLSCPSRLAAASQPKIDRFEWLGCLPPATPHFYSRQTSTNMFAR